MRGEAPSGFKVYLFFGILAAIIIKIAKKCIIIKKRLHKFG